MSVASLFRAVMCSQMWSSDAPGGGVAPYLRRRVVEKFGERAKVARPFHLPKLLSRKPLTCGPSALEPELQIRPEPHCYSEASLEQEYSYYNVFKDIRMADAWSKPGCIVHSFTSPAPKPPLK